MTVPTLAAAAALSPLVWRNRSERPLIGVLAVMIGALISTLNTRITSIGLADLRGALGLGFDDGSWVSTVFSAAQMVVAPAAGWMGLVFSTRRVLLSTGAVFAIASLLPPFTHDYATLLALQMVRGLSVGAFIPAALGFVLRSLPPQWWIWGIAAYAFRFTFSQNIGPAIEGWWSDHELWQWIFWQNTALTPVMLLLVAISMPRRPVDRELLGRTDWAGILYAGLGFGLVYAGVDQGNRLDWFNSGLVDGLLLAGALLILAWAIHEWRTEFPLIRLKIAALPNVLVPSILIGIFGFGANATSYIVPDYLTRVQGLRALQISDALYWVALPQIVLVPLVALLLQRIDARLLLVVGFFVIAIGAWLGVDLTHDWVSANFIPSAAVAAVGLAFAITALITYTIANVTPPQAAAIAAMLQIARLIGNEFGSALIQTFVRVREQVYSNLIGLHVIAGSTAAEQATAQFSGPFSARPTGLGAVALQGAGTLAGLVRREAYVLAYIDSFWLIAWVSAAAMLLVLLLPTPPPNPLTPPRLRP